MICMYTPIVIATIHAIESLYLRNELFCDVKHQQAQWTLSCLKFDHKKSSNDMQPCYILSLHRIEKLFILDGIQETDDSSFSIVSHLKTITKALRKRCRLDKAQHAHRNGKALNTCGVNDLMSFGKVFMDHLSICR